LINLILSQGLFGLRSGGFLGVAAGDKTEQLLDLLKTFSFTASKEMSVTSDLTVYPGTTQILHGDFFTNNRLDDLGTCDEHLGDLIHHENKVGQCGRINGTSRTGAQNHRDLGDDSGADGVSEEDFTITGKRVDSFLNAGTPGVIDANEGHLHLQGMVHDFGDFPGMHQAQRPTGNRKVLSKNTYMSSVNSSGTGDNTVTVELNFIHVKIPCIVLHKHIILRKGPFIQNGCNPVACGQLTHRELFFNGFVSATFNHLLPSFL